LEKETSETPYINPQISWGTVVCKKFEEISLENMGGNFPKIPSDQLTNLQSAGWKQLRKFTKVEDYILSLIFQPGKFSYQSILNALKIFGKVADTITLAEASLRGEITEKIHAFVSFDDHFDLF
jgi:hypothetical protein